MKEHGQMTPVLVAWAPEGTDREEREALRAELEEGIRRRLLVLDRSVSICVLELPLPIPREWPGAEPPDASGEPDEKRPEEREEKAEKCPPTVRARHNPRTAEEKTEIMARLVKFRESPCPIDIWRKVGKGLEKLGFQKMGGPKKMEADGG